MLLLTMLLALPILLGQDLSHTHITAGLHRFATRGQDTKRLLTVQRPRWVKKTLKRRRHHATPALCVFWYQLRDNLLGTLQKSLHCCIRQLGKWHRHPQSSPIDPSAQADSLQGKHHPASSTAPDAQPSPCSTVQVGGGAWDGGPCALYLPGRGCMNRSQ